MTKGENKMSDTTEQFINIMAWAICFITLLNIILWI